MPKNGPTLMFGPPGLRLYGCIEALLPKLVVHIGDGQKGPVEALSPHRPQHRPKLVDVREPLLADLRVDVVKATQPGRI